MDKINISLILAMLAIFLSSSTILSVTLPTHHAEAAENTTGLEVSGWIPYWASAAGAKDAQKHISALDEINPFAFSVKENGTIKDLAGLKKSTWKKLIQKARSEGVLIIPTVMWSSGQQTHAVLSNNDTRKKHIDEIVSMVQRGKYDGVDIDYEGKWPQTKVFYSLFLLQLKQALGDKILSCTIEARTPPESLYATMPAVLEYANDLPTIGSACDQVKIMTYDQQRADLDLNGANIGAPYVPVSDPAWVRKVIAVMSQSIPRNKISLGIPTYGREWSVTVAPQWFKSYQNLQSVNPDKALDIADDYNVTPVRNSAGEVSFTFVPEGSPYEFLKEGLTKNRREHIAGNTIAQKALAHANLTNQTLKFNIVWWSDAEAIRQKVELARELGLRGVAIFKIDGEEDMDMWEIFE